MRYLFGVIAIIDKRLIGKQPYVEHYSECDIVCWYYSNFPPTHPPQYEGYLFVTYLERRVCEETQRAPQWLILPWVGGCGLKNMTTTTTTIQ